MKKLLALLLVVSLMLVMVVTAFAAPNMQPNGKGLGHKKDLCSHDKERNGNGYGHVKFNCCCSNDDPVAE